MQFSFHLVTIFLTLVTNKNKYTQKKQYKNNSTNHTKHSKQSTHIIKTPTQLSKSRNFTKPTHTHTQSFTKARYRCTVHFVESFNLHTN